MNYFASILLESNSYEAELNAQILEVLRSSPSAPEIASPAVLPGPPNRAYFIERFLSELARIPFSVEITTPQQEFKQQIDSYLDGHPDPADSNDIVPSMSLDIRMELRGNRDAKMSFREFAHGELVCVNIAFDPSTIHGGRWRKDVSPQQESDLPGFRDLLLALIDTFPVITATLGLDIIAVGPDVPHGEFRLDNGKLLHNFLSKERRAGRKENVDCIFIDAYPWGFEKPFVYDCIEPRIKDTGAWAGRPYYDMHLVEEMRATVERAEQAYTRMYDSRRPQDDKDDALLFLSQAIKQATALGLEKEAVRLKERDEHIMAVYNSQFRWR